MHTFDTLASHGVSPPGLSAPGVGLSLCKRNDVCRASLPRRSRRAGGRAEPIKLLRTVPRGRHVTLCYEGAVK